LKRSIPCYYLVYVEVMPAFRGLGLGNRIITAFMEFLKNKKAAGILDNIIPLKTQRMRYTPTSDGRPSRK